VRPRAPRIGGPRAARALLALALVGALAATMTTPASAAVKLSVVKSKPFTVSAGEGDYRFAFEEYEWVECHGSDRALTIGWTDAHAPMALIYSHTWNDDGNLGFGTTRPAKATRVRGVVVCAKGKFKADAKINLRADTVKCSKRQLALGIPIDGGPMLSSPVASRPAGKHAWLTTGEGADASAKAICVAASAFKRVKLVKRKAQFKPGSAKAVVKASCARGTRPISWGYEAGTLPSNELLRPEDIDEVEGMTAPYVAASLPSGARGWALTFRTPDGARARSGTSLALSLVCAKPA
jgi:hypothetical protein